MGFAIVVGMVAGCGSTEPAPAPATPPAQKSDVHVRTPRVDVDVEHKRDNKGVNVEVQKR